MIDRRLTFAMSLVLALVCAAATGCVQRRLMVRSNPPGAQLYIDEQPIGKTPVSVPYVYYGTRNFRLEKDGYETLVTKHEVAPVWYQYPPIDFVSENLWPWELRDERVVDFQLQPQQIVPTEQLMSRAEGLRRAVSQGYSSPLPGMPPVPGALPPGGGFPPALPPNPNAPPGP